MNLREYLGLDLSFLSPKMEHNPEITLEIGLGFYMQLASHLRMKTESDLNSNA